MNRIFSTIVSVAVGAIIIAPDCSAGELENLRGQRYGEVLLGKGGVMIDTLVYFK